MNKLDGKSLTDTESTRESVIQLRLLQSLGGRITRSSRSITELSNGLPYFFVEVTTANGSQAVIPAYGDEALALYGETTKLLEPTLTISTR
jgi:hypothetical protein